VSDDPSGADPNPSPHVPTGRFVHRTRPLRVTFGAGATGELPDELEALGLHRVLVVTTPRGEGEVGPLLERLGGRVVGVFAQARLHVPVEVAEAAREQAVRLGADGLLAVGGGSPVGVAKVVALRTGLPIVALPTTYSGSEMTSVWGLTEGGRKRTGRDERVAPRGVVYDPEWTLGLPGRTSAESGMNAVAHAVEALYAHDGSPLSGLLAEEGIRLLGRALPEVVRDPLALEPRTAALLGAHLAGWALELTSMGLHHKLCHVLGGMFGLSHARVHAVLLPHVAAFQEPAAPAALARVARALGEEHAGLGLHALNRELGITGTLRDLGLEPGDLEQVARAAGADAYPSPRRPTEDGVLELLRRAWEGAEPSGGPQGA